MASDLPAGDKLFRGEYEHEMERWFRKRFNLLCASYVVIGLLEALSLLGMIFLLRLTGIDPRIPQLGCVEVAAKFLVLGFFYHYRAPHTDTRASLLRWATLLILSLGAVTVLLQILQQQLIAVQSERILWVLMTFHLFASLFLPWTPRESLRPIFPLYVIWLLYTIARAAILPDITGDAGPSTTEALVYLIVSPAVFLPGIALSAWRFHRHRRRFGQELIGKHFQSLRKDLAHAREIHESLFPKKYDDGYIKFDYYYVPMREVGGDFIHCTISPQGIIHLALVDVTGHGLAAAMTVNRLFGELERIRAESQNTEPAHVLKLLNRYIFLTMSRHNIFATAACLALDPYMGELLWASAGHPPGFLRSTNGNVRELESTGMVLGAVDADAYDCEQVKLQLAPGDELIAYTDGAFEARNSRGTQYSLQALRSLIRSQPGPRNWPQYINAAVRKHSAGRSEDDVLIASIVFQDFRLETMPAPESALEGARV